MLAACREFAAVAHLDLGSRLHASERRVGHDLDVFGRGALERGVVVTGRLELRQGERAVVHDHRRGVVRGDHRLELALVAGKAAVQVEGGAAQAHAHLLHACRIDAVLLDQIKQSRVHALERRRRGPQPQRNLRELPARAEIGGGERRYPEVAALDVLTDQGAAQIGRDVEDGVPLGHAGPPLSRSLSAGRRPA